MHCRGSVVTFQFTGLAVPGALGVWVSGAWGVRASFGVAWLSPLGKLFAGWVRGVGLYSVRIELRNWSLKYPHLNIN